MKKKKPYKHLSKEERFAIEVMRRARVAIRHIARILGRSPNTVSREIQRRTVNGRYVAEKAHHKACVSRWRAKRQCMKVALDSFLTAFVTEKLREKWSPKQISGHLRNMGITVSPKAIYKFAYARSLERHLFWRWNKKKSGRKGYRHQNPKDDRKYIEERPSLDGVGHLEMDFIVSKQSAWVLLVIVDRHSKRTWIVHLPNRKRATVRDALSCVLRDVPLKSITTDNDIAFVNWKELEALLNTRIYFTHPYHSWEKGLVENTNRWIRCFVPKKRDISAVTKEEMIEIDRFLNERPREVIGFRTTNTVYLEALKKDTEVSYLRGC